MRKEEQKQYVIKRLNQALLNEEQKLTVNNSATIKMAIKFINKNFIGCSICGACTLLKCASKECPNTVDAESVLGRKIYIPKNRKR